MSKECLVVLSGGQDSTTCAALCKKEYEEVHAITFNYNQRHIVEIQAAISVARALELESHEILDVGPILKSSSPLVSAGKVEEYETTEDLPKGVEPTFVPGRNILFLSIAANRAAHLGAKDIFTGVCQEDFAGYWDCRQDFIDSMAKAISQGVNGDDGSLRIRTPLMNLTKAESVLFAKEILGEDFERVMGKTHTCYKGVKGGCGKCHACLLRERGFKEAGIKDPLKKQSSITPTFKRWGSDS